MQRPSAHHPVDPEATKVASFCPKRPRSMRNDPDLNIRLVAIVRQYPILYNYFLAGYSNKSRAERIWNEIGSKLNQSGTACRERWMTLRGNYSRALKSFRSDNPPKRDYYLARHMQFLIPYMKIRLEMRQQNTSATPVKTEKPAEQGDSDDDDQFDEDKEETDLVIDDDTSRSSQCDNSQAPKRKNKMDHSIGGRGTASDDSPDLSFFKSLLPEMALLSHSQKTNFKISMLKSLNDLLHSNGMD